MIELHIPDDFHIVRDGERLSFRDMTDEEIFEAARMFLEFLHQYRHMARLN